MANITSTRQNGWFMCSTSSRSMLHYTIDGGHTAICNKRFSSRLAPLNDGTGWGYEVTAELDADSPFEVCPRCVAKQPEATCANCDQQLFRRPDGTWDLVYVLQANTKICFHDHGTQNDEAYYAGRAHTPASA